MLQQHLKIHPRHFSLPIGPRSQWILGLRGRCSVATKAHNQRTIQLTALVATHNCLSVSAKDNPYSWINFSANSFRIAGNFPFLLPERKAATVIPSFLQVFSISRLIYFVHSSADNSCSPWHSASWSTSRTNESSPSIRSSLSAFTPCFRIDSTFDQPPCDRNSPPPESSFSRFIPVSSSRYAK